jgi:hypothetical protein
MRRLWPLFVLELLAPPRLAHAEPGPVPGCPSDDGTLALFFDGDGWTDAFLLDLQGQLVVEAERLGLIACDGRSTSLVATVRVQITSAPDGLTVELWAQPDGDERRLRRELGAAQDQAAEYPAELAMVIGELVREVLRAPPITPAAPPPTAMLEPAPVARPPRWALGVRGIAEVQWARGTPFLGADVVGRLRPFGAWELSMSGAWRQTPRAETNLGAVEGLLLGGGPGLSYRLLGDHHRSVAVSAGARIAGLRFNGTPRGDAIGAAVWDWAATAQLGVELAYAPATAFRLVLGLGAIYGLRSVTAQAGPEDPLSSRGPGLYLSLGGEGWL